MSTNPEARAWLQVRADALRHNYARIRDNLGSDVRILPMVKADAYGLGVRGVVECLEAVDPWGFGVATVAEGIALRALGVVRPVLVCSPAPAATLAEAVEHDLQLSVSSHEGLGALGEAADAVGGEASFHVDVDTGMGRSGFDWRMAGDWLPDVQSPPSGTRLAGVFTHLHSADENEHSIAEQWSRFHGVLGHLDEGAEGLLVHVLNSAGIFRTPHHARSMVRPGIFLYGGRVGEGQPEPEPVVSLHARVVRVREVPPGTTLGYGSTYCAAAAERWATLAVGYGDGLPRALGNRGHALVGGASVPIIGRISMDVTVVDITGVPEVTEGAVATLLGSDGDSEIRVDDVAALAGTISYEVLTGFNARLPRVWTDPDSTN